MLPGIAATGFIGVAAATLGGVLQLPALVTLAVAGAAITLVYLAAVWMFGLKGLNVGSLSRIYLQ
jgi:membrane protein EpsK